MLSNVAVGKGSSWMPRFFNSRFFSSMVSCAGKKTPVAPCAPCSRSARKSNMTEHSSADQNGALSDRSSSHKKRRKYLEEEEKLDLDSSSPKLAMSSPEIRKRSHSQSRKQSHSSRHIKHQDSEERQRKNGHKKDPKTRVTESLNRTQEKKKDRTSTPPSDDDKITSSSTKNTNIKKRRKQGRSTPHSSDDEAVFDQYTPASSRRRAIEDDLIKKDGEGESKKLPKTGDDTLEGTPHRFSFSHVSEEVERLQTLFVDDAGALFKQFEQAFGDATKHLRKPNVLLTGSTGAGKSSLINAVFGQKLAKTGTGVPITQHFTYVHSYFFDSLLTANTPRLIWVL